MSTVKWTAEFGLANTARGEAPTVEAARKAARAAFGDVDATYTLSTGERGVNALDYKTARRKWRILSEE